MNAYIFILAVLTNDGTFRINHVIVPECPAQIEVKKFMEEKVKAGEVREWGGTCAPLVDSKTKEM